MSVEPLERVLLCFDGSAEARSASRIAVEIAARFKSRLTIATVFSSAKDSDEMLMAGLVPAFDGKTLASLVEELEGRARKLGVSEVSAVSLWGEVVGTLRSYLTAHPQDLVVVGSRGLSRGQRLIQGSLSLDLAGNLPADVLIVRPTRSRRRAAAAGTAANSSI